MPAMSRWMDYSDSKKRLPDNYNPKAGRLSRTTTRRKQLTRLAIILLGVCVVLWRWRSSSSSTATSSSATSPPASLRKPPSRADSDKNSKSRARSPVRERERAPPLLLKTPSPAARHAWKALHNAWPNPLDKSAPLQFDDKLVVESFSSDEIVAGKPVKVIFRCDHDEDELCPEAYRVWFEGPSVHSPTYEDSEEKDASGRRIAVTFTLHDPGEYRMFAWPEHDSCGQWAGTEILYNKRVVHDSPRIVTVTGNAPVEKSGLCHSTRPRSEAGRWISKAFLNPYHMTEKSPYYDWLSAQLEPTHGDEISTIYNYVWAPYECKIPHNSVRSWIDQVRPKTMVIFGDSLLRDLFCLVIWRALDGPEKGPCDFFGEGYHKTNKQLSIRRSDGETSHLHFVWLPEGDLTVLNSFLSSLPKAPSHILFGVALHLAKHPIETFVSMVRPAIERLGELQGTKSLVRTSGGVVQAIQCYDRIGGQRFQMEDINQVIEGMVNGVDGVELFDVYPTLNDRPEATPDGRHWADIGRYWQERPEIGSAEFALLDAMFHTWTL